MPRRPGQFSQESYQASSVEEPLTNTNTWASGLQSAWWGCGLYVDILNIKALRILRTLTCNQGWKQILKGVRRGYEAILANGTTAHLFVKVRGPDLLPALPFPPSPQTTGHCLGITLHLGLSSPAAPSPSNSASLPPTGLPLL